MTFEEFLERFDEFVESKQFLREDDGDPDEYRRGYRNGYYDGLEYVRDWLEEVSEESEAEGLDE